MLAIPEVGRHDDEKERHRIEHGYAQNQLGTESPGI